MRHRSHGSHDHKLESWSRLVVPDTMVVLLVQQNSTNPRRALALDSQVKVLLSPLSGVLPVHVCLFGIKAHVTFQLAPLLL